MKATAEVPELYNVMHNRTSFDAAVSVSSRVCRAPLCCEVHNVLNFSKEHVPLRSLIHQDRSLQSE